jgi:hypothetical protein
VEPVRLFQQYMIMMMQLDSSVWGWCTALASFRSQRHMMDRDSQSAGDHGMCFDTPLPTRRIRSVHPHAFKQFRSLALLPRICLLFVAHVAYALA